jgi:hypothetical protein
MHAINFKKYGTTAVFYTKILNPKQYAPTGAAPDVCY